MPIYEFKCPNCEKKFEELVSSDIKVKCPDCKTEAKKQFSTFGFSSSLHSGGHGGKSSSSSCSSCSSSNCGTCSS